jgi:hypothetical protein
MPTLLVRCKACDADFPTPIGEPTSGPSGVIISGLKLHCPRCGNESAYDTQDFHLPKIPDAPPEGGASSAEENSKGERKAMNREPATRMTGAVVVDPEARAPRGE